MGNWNISIRGVGQHHNKSTLDVEQMTARFVEDLRKAGHHLASASVTHGGEVNVIDGVKSDGLLSLDPPRDL